MSEFNDLMKKKAVALKYDSKQNRAPVIVASGMGYMAERITQAAMEAGVPVYEDSSMASMLTRLKTGTAIPPELYQAVVDIYLYFLNDNREPDSQLMPVDSITGAEDNADEKNG